MSRGFALAALGFTLVFVGPVPAALAVGMAAGDLAGALALVLVPAAGFGLIALSERWD